MARAPSRLLMLADPLEDLVVGREAEGLVLRVDELPVEGDVEDAAVPALEVSGQPELLLDGGLQTGGLGVVVSFGAVGDQDLHTLTPLLTSDGTWSRLDSECHRTRLR